MRSSMPNDVSHTSMGIYRDDVRKFLCRHQDIFGPLHTKWNGIMHGINLNQPSPLSDNSHQLVGILGPGAVGKGTVQKHLSWKRIINTTTRQKRKGETHQEDYYFTTEEEFQESNRAGSFAITAHRPGRGWYGIDWGELDAKLSSSSEGPVLVEENAESLSRLARSLTERKVGAFIRAFYLLPPTPRFVHLAARYIGRCWDQAQNPLPTRVYSWRETIDRTGNC